MRLIKFAAIGVGIYLLWRRWSDGIWLWQTPPVAALPGNAVPTGDGKTVEQQPVSSYGPGYGRRTGGYAPVYIYLPAGNSGATYPIVTKELPAPGPSQLANWWARWSWRNLRFQPQRQVPVPTRR